MWILQYVSESTCINLELSFNFNGWQLWWWSEFANCLWLPSLKSFSFTSRNFSSHQVFLFFSQINEPERAQIACCSVFLRYKNDWNATLPTVQLSKQTYHFGYCYCPIFLNPSLNHWTMSILHILQILLLLLLILILLLLIIIMSSCLKRVAARTLEILNYLEVMPFELVYFINLPHRLIVDYFKHNIF